MNTYNLFKKRFSLISIVLATLFLASCGGGGGSDDNNTAAPVTAALAALGFDIKTFRFTWADVSDATFYRLMENPDGASGFTQAGADIAQGTQTFDHVVPLYLRTGASYFLQSCNSAGCIDGATISISGTLADAVGYFKSSNTVTGDEFGIDVALSSDGKTLAVGAKNELSNRGAVYVFINNSGSWVKQADITAAVAAVSDEFGTAVSLSADGNLLAVGAPRQGNTGSVYTFTRSGNAWSQQDKLKALVTGVDFFGDAVSLSDDGSTLAVGAKSETSANHNINGTDDGNGAITQIGAAYIFTIDANGMGTQQAYIKADNADAGDLFGASVSLSSDGNTLAVGALGEDGSTSGTAPANDAGDALTGAVYVFKRSSTTWIQEEYIKASASGIGDEFGNSVSLSDDGNTLAVGARSENSMTTVINGDDTDESAPTAGAVYVFTRSVTIWTQQAYVKASNADAGDRFGQSVSLSADGNMLAVGADSEESASVGVNGDEVTGALNSAGASYLYVRDAGLWSQQAYLKASNTGQGDSFGTSIELSGDGDTLAVGAKNEDGGSTGVGGSDNDSAVGSGAVYLY